MVTGNVNFISVFKHTFLFCAGCDVVEWLHAHVEGFHDRRDARKYASQMLKAGYIRHTVNKITFSEQCYYVFGDLCTGVYVTAHY